MEVLIIEVYNQLESYLILNKQYSSYFVLSVLYVLTINIIIIILCILDYQIYIITKATVKLDSDNKTTLLVPVKINNIKYYTDNDYLKIGEKEYTYHIKNIDNQLYIDDQTENYQLLKIEIDLPHHYQINNYLVTIKIPTEKRKMINYLLEFF